MVLGYDFSSKTGAYWIVLSLVLPFAVVYAQVRDSDYGLALRAMHDSEDATRAVGVNSMLLKALMLFLSAFMTGVMGAFNAHYINFLEPDYAFSGLWTMLPIVAAIFGGYRTISGPLDRRRGRLSRRPARVQGGHADRPPDRAGRASRRDDPVSLRKDCCPRSRNACRGRAECAWPRLRDA